MRQNAGKVTKPRTIRIETNDPAAAEPLSTLEKIMDTHFENFFNLNVSGS